MPFRSVVTDGFTSPLYPVLMAGVAAVLVGLLTVWSPMFPPGAAVAHASPTASASDRADSTAPPAPVQSPASDQAASDQARQAPVIVVGAPGLRWDDIDPTRTPDLWALFEEGSAATLAVRSVRRAACPVDGWLALSSGRRAGDAPQAAVAQCRVPPEPTRVGDGYRVEQWPTYLDEADRGIFQAHPGLFADTLAQAGRSTTAIGPGAAIALARSDGTVHGRYEGRSLDQGALAEQVREAAQPGSLTVVDAGALRDPEDLLPGDLSRVGGARQYQARRIDRVVAAVREGAPPGSTIMVASLADSGFTPHLEALVATGPAPGGISGGYRPSLLGASSTRQPGMVQATDLMPTLLALMDVDAPADLPGAIILPQADTPASTDDRYRRLIDLDLAATEVQPLVSPFFNGLVIAQILLYGGAALALRRSRKQVAEPRRRMILAVLRRVAVVFATVPIATFLANLIPWWRSHYTLLAVVAAVVAFVVVISTIALLGPWRNQRLGPLGFIGAVTAGVLALDVATGSRLQISSLMGQQPLVAGRFYGLGNVQFALFASGSLMLTIATADAFLRRGRRWLAVATVVVLGLVTVVIDGTPGLGSDFGGPPAIIPAFTLMALLVSGVRITWRRLLAIGVGTAVIVVLISVGDWLRPPQDRTHFGRFVQTVIEGGAWPVIARKAAQNWAILTGSFLTVLLPFAAVFLAFFLMRPGALGAPALQRTYEEAPALRHGLVSLIVLVAIGALVNDSGTVVPAISAVLVIPLLIATGVRTLELLDDDRPVQVEAH